MLRQRSSIYRHSQIPTFFLVLFLLLLLVFFFRPRLTLVVPGNRQLAPFSVVKEDIKNGFKDNTASVPPISPPPPLPLPPLLPKSKARHSINCSVSSTCSTSRRIEGGIKWDPSNRPSCPAYFGYIYEDLKPWRTTGITLKMVEHFEKKQSFRITIVDGRMYLIIYKKRFQTRDIFSIWGFIQLLEYYPGLLPDLDLIFDCVDWPIVKARDYSDANPPPPLFRYCADDATLDIPFPDWSFWGWSEINIRPWGGLLTDILKGNASEGQDWNARLYIQDWLKEAQEGYKKSELSDQCDHRYKIYVEGSAWSVSLKNILACDSPTLMLKPKYHDFFSRGLMPMEHYWPVGLDRRCESIKLAIDWGNKHPSEAKAIGKAASDFLKNEVNIANVYDYMFHLLNEYAKLLKYKPSVPKGAKEICSTSMFCSRKNRVERRFMKESLVKTASESGPCNLPSSATFYESLKDWNERKANAFQKVEEMEREARDGIFKEA
ncbi:uncharacterized protein LOC131028570 isoform X2 [Cryptomeria japonica]|uniref:uncharacterized protein LOC131028570 isoform X2 n=1 Tax=Cryptomeria japonica TaxID=3369 RepID=UPI0025AD33FF|nr:uncharacterized protein LOC131028570 isoform X2 [Cryptomeria japonica]